MLDNDLVFYLAGCIFFLILNISKRKPKPEKRDLIQLKNPISKRYVLVDRTKGSIISHKKSPGPYKGVPIHKASTDEDVEAF